MITRRRRLCEEELDKINETAKKMLKDTGFSWEPDCCTISALIKLRNEITILRRELGRAHGQ